MSVFEAKSLYPQNLCYIHNMCKLEITYYNMIHFEAKDWTVIVNNSNTIYTTNNHLSPQITEHEKTTTYDVGNPVLASDRHKTEAGLNWLMWL